MADFNFLFVENDKKIICTISLLQVELDLSALI